jgi:hypothetical protein
MPVLVNSRNVMRNTILKFFEKFKKTIVIDKNQ